MEPRDDPDPRAGALDAIEAALSPEVMLQAYARGWFPMASEDAAGRIEFFSANPRGIIPIDRFRLPRSVRRGMARERFRLSVDGDFEGVVRGCAAGRADGVWLSEPLIASYVALNAAGFAHSIECRRGDEVVGGLFGVSLGAFFSSESMFHRASEAGNQTLVGAHRLLHDAGVTLWDIQMVSPHTARFGAVQISREDYLVRLRDALSAGEPRFP